MNSGLHLGRWAGVNVRAHWSVLIVGVFLGASLVGDIGVGPALVAIVSFMLSILAHEFGHALVARRFGVGTKSIQLWALGGVAHLDREAPTPRAEGWIAAAGPLVSLALGITTFMAWWQLGSAGADNAYVGVLGWLGFINAALAVFNMLPGAPLDGGRIVKAVRWAIHGDRFRATREASAAGQVIAVLVGTAGMALTMSGAGGMWLVLTAAFLWVNAKVESAAADTAERLDGITVGDLTWLGVAAAGTDMDADSMLWQRRRLGHAGGVSVTDDGGQPVGLVLESQLWAVPADERPWVLLTQLMVPFDSTARATADESLTSILPRLNPRNPIVTVWDGDRLVGMIPPQRLADQLGWTD